jgi:hypothetical protein
LRDGDIPKAELGLDPSRARVSENDLPVLHSHRVAGQPVSALFVFLVVPGKTSLDLRHQLYNPNKQFAIVRVKIIDS